MKSIKCGMLGLLLLTSVIIMLLSHEVVSQSIGEYMPARPERPDRFENRDQLKEYVRQLIEYYDLIGKPRLGKRSVDYANDMQINLKFPCSTEKSCDYFAKLLFQQVDSNRDGFISGSELEQFIVQQDKVTK